MWVTKRYCDICNREIIPKFNDKVKINGYTYCLERASSQGLVDRVDLCKKCQKNLIKFIKSNIEKEK